MRTAAINSETRAIALPLLAYGLWIRLTFIAAMAVAGSLVALFDGSSGVVKPLLAALLAAAVAVFSWYRAGVSIKAFEPRGFAATSPAPLPAAAPTPA